MGFKRRDKVKKFARLIAENTKNENHQIFIYIILEDRKLVDAEYYGCRKKGSKIYPFVLYPPVSSIVKWQPMQSRSIIPTSTNLFTKNIEIGEYFTIRRGAMEYTFKITKLSFPTELSYR